MITGGENPGSEKRVEQYNLGGSMGRLPDMKTGRAWHACGKYLQDGEIVSIPTMGQFYFTDFKCNCGAGLHSDRRMGW